jgi:hypothetical protein
MKNCSSGLKKRQSRPKKAVQISAQDQKTSYPDPLSQKYEYTNQFPKLVRFTLDRCLGTRIIQPAVEDKTKTQPGRNKTDKKGIRRR